MADSETAVCTDKQNENACKEEKTDETRLIDAIKDGMKNHFIIIT